MIKKKISITIDEQEYTVNEGQILIDVTDRLGIYIPRFCYHDKLSIAANCRMCLIEVDNTTNPQPACATPVTDGMVIKTHSEKAQQAQQGTMEFLLINHPLDCPICDQAGECELQDLAYSYGQNQSRYKISKLTKSNDNLGPLISTDMTRCILCTRCTRFADEIAGLPELGTIGRGDSSNISTYIAKSVDHELSGNMIDLCPVGALNNKPYRYTERTWELDQIESISPHDCVGSNIYIHVKGEKIKRIVPKCNEEINEIWISDRDRFAFDGIYSNDRLLNPMVRKGKTLINSSWEEAIKIFSNQLLTLTNEKKNNEVAGLISPSCTLNQQYLFSYLFKNLDCYNIDHRLKQVDFTGDSMEPLFPGMGIKPHEIEKMNTILIIGSDIRREAPIIAHWIKKAASNGASINIINEKHGEYFFPIDNLILSSSEALAENLGLVLKALFEGSQIELLPSVLNKLEQLPKPSPSHYKIAETLSINDNNLLLSGLVSNSHTDFALIRSYLNILSDISHSIKGELTYGANTIGAYLAGCIPHKQALGESQNQGLNAIEICSKNHELLTLYDIEPEDCLYVENLKQSIMESKMVVQFTPYLNPFMEENADILFPINTPYESAGTFINVSGITQDFNMEINNSQKIPANDELLNDIISSLKLTKPSIEDFKQKVTTSLNKSKIGESIPIDFPSGKSTRNINKLITYGLYNIDSTVRRSRPLQETQDSKSSQYRKD